MGVLYFVTTRNTKKKVRFSSLPLVKPSLEQSASLCHHSIGMSTSKHQRSHDFCMFLLISFHLSLPTDTNTGTPAISTTTTVEIRKSSVMTTEITSKVEKIPTTATSSSTCPSVETEEEKAKRLLYCSLCKVAVNSASQLEAHNSGTKHKTMLEARNGSGTIKAFPRAGVKGKGPVNKGNTGLQNKTFHCEICDVHVNSETQLKQHISSRRHKDRAAGKPPKPKYSPYNKLQKGTHPLGVKLVFSKEPSKPMAPRILPNPLAAAAAAAAVAVNSPFSLRTAPAATLFQTSALPPALLRPAPGPIRTTHTPVLFAPY
ncbi:hypothetical protein DV515_00001655 [Chloebia gouldiae]|uniref:C2H2-type domain-containing protein n=1 Tax=Chloebia gouldiae TaxID=44316 RepID=A0A3L8SYZ7_CHLGU|nr:hypothetical protein DV515_00001655 [Chloebia gouldiae]